MEHRTAPDVDRRKKSPFLQHKKRRVIYNANCPRIWTLFLILFTRAYNYDTLTSEGDIAHGHNALPGNGNSRQQLQELADLPVAFIVAFNKVMCYIGAMYYFQCI